MKLLGQGDDVVGEQAQSLRLHASQRLRVRRIEPLRLAAGVFGLLRLGLRDVPVLAVQAAVYAAGRSQREGRRAGQEVEEGLLFDRIDVHRARVAVGQRVERAVLIDPGTAVAAVFRLQEALVRAHLALDVAAQLEVVPGLGRPAPGLPLPPEFALRGIAVEDVGRRQRLGPATQVIGRPADRRQPGHRADASLEKPPPRRLSRCRRRLGGRLPFAKRHFFAAFLIHPQRLIAK